MRLFRKLALGASMLALVLSACSTGGGSSGPGSTIGAGVTVKVGSDGFYEARLLGEIYGQVLEANGYTVQRNLGLGTRQVTAAAIEKGEIDLKPEYLGSGLGFYDKTKPGSDPAKNQQELQTILATKGITVLGYTPGQDTNAFVVRSDTASQFNLKKISDLTAVAAQLKWGLPPECQPNPLCGGALKDAYGIDVTKLQVTPLTACDAPIAEALNSKAIDVAELCSTQPAIQQFGFIALQDDKVTQPAENLAPIVRDDFLAKTNKAAFTKILNDVSAKITTEVLLKLGVEVAVNNKNVDDVARTWLKEQGFVK